MASPDYHQVPDSPTYEDYLRWRAHYGSGRQSTKSPPPSSPPPSSPPAFTLSPPPAEHAQPQGYGDEEQGHAPQYRDEPVHEEHIPEPKTRGGLHPTFSIAKHGHPPARSDSVVIPGFNPTEVSPHHAAEYELDLHHVDSESSREGNEEEYEEEVDEDVPLRRPEPGADSVALQHDVSIHHHRVRSYAAGAGREKSTKGKPGTIKGEKDTLLTYAVGFAGPSDPAMPTNWPVKQKWLILAILCSASLCVTATSSIQASTNNGVRKDFGVGLIPAVAGVSLYVLGLGVGSLFLAPLSEFFGRSLIYLFSFAAFTALNIPVAFSQNIGVFLLFRYLTGLAGSAFLSVAGGSVTDLWTPPTVGIPISVYTLSPLIGPAFGPIIGGFINQNANWRITFYVITGWAGVEFVLLWFFVPETLAPMVLKRIARKRRLQTGDGRWYAPAEKDKRDMITVLATAITVPFDLILCERMALLLDLWTSFILGIIYLFFQAVPYTFRTVYGFNLQETGLAFIPLGMGMIIATASQPFWAKRYRDASVRAGGKPPPEARLPIGMAGALIVPAGLLWFSLSSFARVHWIMPLIGTMIFGIGATYVFTSVFAFLVSTYSKNAASAMAGNTLMRCTIAGSFPLFSNAMYRDLGPVAATGLLAGLTALMIPIPFVFYKIGPRLRTKSKYGS